MGTPLLWAAFLIGAAIVVGIDLFAAGGKEITAKKAGIWTAIWVSLSLSFAGFLHFEYGTIASVPFVTAYVIEYALSPSRSRTARSTGSSIGESSERSCSAAR